MKTLLIMKHWQLFCLILVCPIFIFISAQYFAFNGNNYALQLMIMTPIVFISFVYLWLYTLGKNLTERLPNEEKSTYKWFKIAVRTPIFFTIFILIILESLTQNFLGLEPLFTVLMILSIPAYFGVIFCLCFCVYYITKTIKTIEVQHSVDFNYFVGDFFLLLFFPLGIWLLQPRINEIFDEQI